MCKRPFLGCAFSDSAITVCYVPPLISAVALHDLASTLHDATNLTTAHKKTDSIASKYCSWASSLAKERKFQLSKLSFENGRVHILYEIIEKHKTDVTKIKSMFQYFRFCIAIFLPEGTCWTHFSVIYTKSIVK